MNIVSKLSIKMYAILGLIIVLSITYSMYTTNVIKKEGLDAPSKAPVKNNKKSPPPKIKPSQPLSLEDIKKSILSILDSNTSVENKLTNEMNGPVLANENRGLNLVKTVKSIAMSRQENQAKLDNIRAMTHFMM